MIFVIIVFAVIVFCAVTYVLNETPFMYRPEEKYALPGHEEMEKPEYGAIDLPNGNADKAIVFFPGFKAAPVQFEYMLNAFSGEYSVCSVLYPGSSVSLDDFARTNYSQWYAAARDQYLAYRKKYKTVYVCGFSMGATIAMTIAAEYSGDPALCPDAIISMAGIVFSNNILGQGVYYDWRLYIVRYLSWITRGIKKTPDLDVNAAPGPVFNDKEHIFSTLYSLKMGLYRARKALRKITVPIMLFHAKGDGHAPYQNMNYIAGRVSSKVIGTKTLDLRAGEFDKYTRHFIPHYAETRDDIIKDIRGFLKDIA